ncbi:orotate phosphoribosyltransferase [Humibacter sp. RRB41]|uniref:orotate phosphoribosyltransferase n=1 Tax=Humibacter sp. RRB41 TaxID=2919946 RepID=UPI001FAAB869|nr:orotate phosphoribosyltransferase [Humibacter sp. RRB41]
MDTQISELARDIDAACRLSGEFTLRSGLIATEYFDKYRFETDPVLLCRVAAAMVPLLPPDTEVLGGLELGGVPIATMVSSLTGLPALFVRKEPKGYGTRKLAEGDDVEGARVTLIEDVITTGGAVRNAAIALRTLGARVHTVVCAIDRSEPGQNVLESIGLTTTSVLTKRMLDDARA